MEVYTYCTYKGSARGYQYAHIKETDVENKSKDSALKTEPFFKEWFENKNGWKMVLKRNAKAAKKGYLLIAALEDVIDIENRQRIDRYAEKVQANKFKDKKETVRQEELRQTQTYINIAIVGELDKIFEIAAGMLIAFQNDGGKQVYEKIEECISHPDVNGYLVDGKKMFSILEELGNRGREVTKNLNKNENGMCLNILDKMKIVKKMNPCIERAKREKKEKIADVLQGIPKPQNFTTDNMIYVAEDDEIKKYGTYHIAISYMNYLVKGLKL